MSTILDYFIPVDSERCQCILCGKCFLLNSPAEFQEKHLETKHPEGFAKSKSVAKEDEPFNQVYTSEEKNSFQIRSEEKHKRKIISKVWYYFHLNADKTKNICNICSHNLRNNGGSTGSMWKHLNYKHNIKKEQNRTKETPHYSNHLRSKVWNYFHFNTDKTKNICNICSKALVYCGGSTTIMWKHLNDTHNIKKEKIMVKNRKSSNADRESEMENHVENIAENSHSESKTSKKNKAFSDSQKEKPFENISEYILQSDMRSTRNISNVRIYCEDGVVSTHKIFLASISNFLSDLFKENDDISDIILPDFNMKDVLLGLENFVSKNDFQNTNEILKLLLGKRQSTAHLTDDLLEVFDENTIKHDQEEEEETVSDYSLNKELLEDYAMSISEAKATNDEKIDNQKVLRNLQNYFFIFDSFNGSSICKRCGKTFRSNQDFSVMVQHMNNCEQKQN